MVSLRHRNTSTWPTAWSDAYRLPCSLYMLHCSSPVVIPTRGAIRPPLHPTRLCAPSSLIFPPLFQCLPLPTAERFLIPFRSALYQLQVAATRPCVSYAGLASGPAHPQSGHSYPHNDVALETTAAFADPSCPSLPFKDSRYQTMMGTLF